MHCQYHVSGWSKRFLNLTILIMAVLVALGVKMVVIEFLRQATTYPPPNTSTAPSGLAVGEGLIREVHFRNQMGGLASRAAYKGKIGEFSG